MVATYDAGQHSKKVDGITPESLFTSMAIL